MRKLFTAKLLVIFCGSNATRQMCILFTDNQANNSVRTPSKYLEGSLTIWLSLLLSFFFLLFRQLAKMNLCAFISLLAFDKAPNANNAQSSDRQTRGPSDMKIVIFSHTYVNISVCVCACVCVHMNINAHTREQIAYE